MFRNPKFDLCLCLGSSLVLLGRHDRVHDREWVICCLDLACAKMVRDEMRIDNSSILEGCRERRIPEPIFDSLMKNKCRRTIPNKRTHHGSLGKRLSFQSKSSRHVCGQTVYGAYFSRVGENPDGTRFLVGRQGTICAPVEVGSNHAGRKIYRVSLGILVSGYSPDVGR